MPENQFETRGLEFFLGESPEKRENQPNWNREEQNKLRLDIKYGNVCLRCGCLSCDRTLEEKKACISSEGGSAK